MNWVKEKKGWKMNKWLGPFGTQRERSKRVKISITCVSSCERMFDRWEKSAITHWCTWKIIYIYVYE